MEYPTNLFQTVQTYQEGELAYLQNAFCMISTFNKRFMNFQDYSGNLGDTVTFSINPKSYSTRSLVVRFMGSEQLKASLTVDQQFSVGRPITAQQLIFNDMKQYMEEFGMADMKEIGSNIEEVVASNATSAVSNPTTHVRNSLSGPYRFYGNGVNPINSFGQLAEMLDKHRTTGDAGDDCVYLPDTITSAIVNSGLNQFTPDRNNKMAMSWDVGDYHKAKFYRSNLMPIHYAGTVGNQAQTLTVISTNSSDGSNITQITCSGATASDADAIKEGDLCEFVNNVGSLTNVKELTYYGHHTSANTCQFRITADAAANGSGNVVLSIFAGVTGGLIAAAGPNQNINTNIVAGMQIRVVPSHLAGMIISGKGGLMAMPKMPPTDPFPYANKVDEKSGASIRSYYATIPFQNQYGYAHDQIMGTMVVPVYSRRIIFPLQ